MRVKLATPLVAAVARAFKRIRPLRAHVIPDAVPLLSLGAELNIS
jgi:hypothetical protein